MSRVKLGDVAREHKETVKCDKSNYPIVGLEHLIPENIRLTQWDLNKENTFTKIFRKGCVLFGRRRAYLKKAVYADFDGICSGDITVIEAIPEKILPELLPFVIQNDDLFDYAVGKSAGSLSPRVKWEHLKNYEFELPDIERQHELAEMLWSIVETKESYERLMAATDELVKSQFIELFGDIHSNPKSWTTKPLKELCDILNGYVFKSELYEPTGIRVIRITNVQKGRVEDLDPQFYPISYEKELEKFILYEGDIVLSLTGNVGRCGLITKDLLPAALNQRVACIRVKEDLINKMFLYSFMNSSIFENDCIQSSKGIAQKNMSTDWLKEYKMFIPPKKMQDEFVRMVEQSDKSKFELENCIKNAVSMYKKILKEYLG